MWNSNEHSDQETFNERGSELWNGAIGPYLFHNQ